VSGAVVRTWSSTSVVAAAGKDRAGVAAARGHDDVSGDRGGVRVILAEHRVVVWFGAVSDPAAREVRTVLDDDGQRTSGR
jgi:hypothetical protein